MVQKVDGSAVQQFEHVSDAFPKDELKDDDL